VVNARLVEQHRRLLEAERRALDDAKAARDRLELLASAGTVLSGSLDPDETLAAIAGTVVPGIADWCRIDLLDENGQLQRRLAHHIDPTLASRALDMARQLRAAPEAPGSMASVIASGQSHYGDFRKGQGLDDAALRQFTQTFGMGAHFLIPLIARGRTIGAMAVIQSESGRDLSPDDRSTVLELGRRAALALDNSRLYAQAAAARLQAEKASRAKDEFLAMLGHELRNPLAPITTALELMAYRDPDSCAEERRVITRQVAHLSRLIDDLLDVSRITQGKVHLRHEPVDMKSVVAHAVEQTRPAFETHPAGVELRVCEGRAVVLGDAVRLTQVLCNLLTNAAKFTPDEGRVTLELTSTDGRVEVAVSDNGIGILADLLPRVFDLFSQGRQDMARQSGGLGLGLAIVRNLVEAHGGSVTASSDGAGRGTRIVVQLPASTEVPAPASDGQATALGSNSARVLVVDDNRDAADTLAELLRMTGYDVRTAGDAPSALAVLDGFVPQLVLLDIGLPGIDGYQLAKMLRDDPRCAGASLVALTGYGRENDRSRAMGAHFDEHLVKPVMADRLFEVLDRLLKRN
jgi:signal transduction histidine kinase/CheY-like chemotaxis protein